MGGQAFQKDRLGPHVVQIRVEIPQIDVIADVALLPRGLHAFTGESGTGKTLILEAIRLICGYDVKRWRNLDTYSVYATVYYPKASGLLSEMGLDVEDTFVVSVQKSGRRVYRINGIPVSKEQVANVLSSLAVFASSDEKMRLGSALYRLSFLDAAVDAGVLSEIREVYAEILALGRRLKVLRMRLNRLESELLPDELWKEARTLWDWIPRYEELKERLDDYEKRQQVRELFQEILRLLSDDGALMRDLRRLDRLVAEADLNVEGIERFWDWLWSVRADVEEKLQDEDIPDDLPELVWRIERLARRAGLYPDELGEFLAGEQNRRGDVERVRKEMASLEDRLAELRRRFGDLAKVLREERSRVAEALTLRVNRYLSLLFTGSVAFETEVVPVDAIDSRLGSDVHFYISRAGRRMKPGEVLSSGELSRFVLALYLASGVMAPVLVFDEIDTGVSGETARKVAELLQQMGRKGQVIVATHSHFVAAASDVQFSWQNGKWVRLSDSQRVAEIARLLGASEEAARELLQYFRGKG